MNTKINSFSYGMVYTYLDCPFREASLFQPLDGKRCEKWIVVESPLKLISLQPTKSCPLLAIHWIMVYVTTATLNGIKTKFN